MEKIRFKHVILFLVMILILFRCGDTTLENLKQRELAQRLGVNLDAYPRTSPFPENYFLVALKPGMAKDEVHEIVREYEQVINCSGGRELYYYYSTDEADAVSFMVFYDEEGKYVDLMGRGDSGDITC